MLLYVTLCRLLGLFWIELKIHTHLNTSQE
jgi:hypothetical protein